MTSPTHAPWYVTEYVIAEHRPDTPVRYAIHAYLIWAHSPEDACINAKNLELRLRDSLRAEDRENASPDSVDYRCLGIHDMSPLKADEMHNGIHLSVVHWPSADAPAVRDMKELGIYPRRHNGDVAQFQKP